MTNHGIQYFSNIDKIFNKGNKWYWVLFAHNDDKLNREYNAKLFIHSNGYI